MFFSSETHSLEIIQIRSWANGSPIGWLHSTSASAASWPWPSWRECFMLFGWTAWLGMWSSKLWPKFLETLHAYSWISWQHRCKSSFSLLLPVLSNTDESKQVSFTDTQCRLNGGKIQFWILKLAMYTSNDTSDMRDISFKKETILPVPKRLL